LFSLVLRDIFVLPFLIITLPALFAFTHQLKSPLIPFSQKLVLEEYAKLSDFLLHFLVLLIQNLDRKCPHLNQYQFLEQYALFLEQLASHFHLQINHFLLLLCLQLSFKFLFKSELFLIYFLSLVHCCFFLKFILSKVFLIFWLAILRLLFEFLGI